jgi:hypothetical protein
VDKHQFDPVALVFGVVFAAAGVIVVSGGRLIDEGRVLVPLGLVALGVGLLFRPARSAATRPTPPTATPPAGTVAWPDAPPPASDAPLPAEPSPDARAPADTSPDDAVDEPEPDTGPRGERPREPGAEFYLGPDWRPPSE